jgi:hypothetical protein
MVFEAFSILPMYNPKYFIDNEMWQYRDPKGPAIHTFVASDGTAIGIFQGKKGARPDLDFRVKILQPKPDAKPFLLPHDEWVVDLLLKAQHHKDAVVRLLDYYLEFYESCKPFDSLEERKLYQPRTLKEIETKFTNVSTPGTMSIGGIAIILELFCLCEKQTPDAHQFKLALQWTKECILGQRDFKNVLNLVIRHREY